MNRHERTSRVLELERVRADFHARFRSWYREHYAAIGAPRTLADLFQVLRGHVVYRRDGWWIDGGREFVAHPFTIWRAGGDCEDLNLVLLGGLALHNGLARNLASAYYPSVGGARHVMLYADGWVWDLVPPARPRMAPQGVELVAWQ